MKLWKKKEEEANIRTNAEEANKKWDELQGEIDKLCEYSDLLCPLTHLSYSLIHNDDCIHNNVLYRAIKERIEKLEKQQKEIEI